MRIFQRSFIPNSPHFFIPFHPNKNPIFLRSHSFLIQNEMSSSTTSAAANAPTNAASSPSNNRKDMRRIDLGNYIYIYIFLFFPSPSLLFVLRERREFYVGERKRKKFFFFFFFWLTGGGRGWGVGKLVIPYRQPSASSEDSKGGDMASTITTTLPMAAVCPCFPLPPPPPPAHFFLYRFPIRYISLFFGIIGFSPFLSPK